MKNNVDRDEIAKFDAIAQDWWNPTGSMRPLHLLNPVRMGYIQSLAPLKGKAVLDVGCGGGILTESLAKHSQKTVGIDLSHDVLTVAKQHALAQQLDIDYQEISVENFATHYPGCYDVITCMEMLEHVPDPTSIVHACATLLKPGGYAFFSTLNRHPKSYLFAILGAEYLLKLLPKGTHQYSRFIRPSELDAWAGIADLTLKDIRGIHYSPIRHRFSLSHDVLVNYLTCYQKKGSIHDDNHA